MRNQHAYLTKDVSSYLNPHLFFTHFRFGKGNLLDSQRRLLGVKDL